ncbi:MAG: carbohydrate kinase family protein [Bacillota bacterium]
MSQKTKNIAVIGGINMDIVGFPHKNLVPGDSNPGKTMLSPGGVGRNIAENIALLGNSVEMYSVVGNDIYGKSLIDETNSSGVDMSYVKIIPGKSTGTYMAILDENMDMHIAISSMEIFSYLDQEYILQNKDHIMESSIIAFDTNLSRENLEFAVQLFKGKKLFLDTVSSGKAINAKEIIGSFHTIKPNKLEAQVLTGIQIHDDKDLIDSARFLHKKGIVNVCISLGPEGVFYSSSEEKGIVRIPDARIKNATGAGDSFQAGLIYGELAGMSLSESIKIASATAAMTMDSESTINKEINIDKVMDIAEKMEVKKL